MQLRQSPENFKLVKLVGTYLFMKKCRFFISGQNLLDIVRYVHGKKKLIRIPQAATAFGFVIFLGVVLIHNI